MQRKESDTFALWDKTRSFWDIKNSLSHERGSEQSEQVSERVSAAEGTSEANRAEQANEWAVQVNEPANEQTDERVAQYSRPNSWLSEPLCITCHPLIIND